MTQLTFSLVNVERQAKQLKPSNHTLKNPYKTYLVMINIMIYLSFFDSILNWSIKKIIIYKTNPVLHDIFNIIKGFLQIFAHDTLLKCVFKFAPCLHQKSDNWALNFVFFYALMLMLPTTFVPNRTTRKCRTGMDFSNFDAKLAPNVVQIFPK